MNIEVIRQPRLMILDIISNLNIDQLNKIPEGFNNNIIWNLGHMIATQQGICYKRSGLAIHVSDEHFEAYKSGSKPEKFVDEAGYEEIKRLMFTTLDQLVEDYNAQVFKNYDHLTTRYGVELYNVDDAIGFLPFHEGLHVGYIMSLKKLV
jgi:hypothetical protein